MTKNQIEEKLGPYRAKIEHATAELQRVADEIAQEICPFKVGQVIPHYGWTRQGCPLRVTGVSCDPLMSGAPWIVRGVRILASGKDGECLAFSLSDHHFNQQFADRTFAEARQKKAGKK